VISHGDQREEVGERAHTQRLPHRAADAVQPFARRPTTGRVAPTPCAVAGVALGGVSFGDRDRIHQSVI
jgi:hypothetical protein